jgi:putative ABC transport system substrate-binding protein
MDRRGFIGLLAVSSISFAQQPAKLWRIGFLTASSRQLMVDLGRSDGFMKALRELGYVEGENLVIEWRFADGDYERLPSLAAELVRLRVDLIVAAPSPAIRAAQQATATIPIVFATASDPVGNGFAASLARPGGNLTGLSNSNLDVSAKTLELLKAVSPKMSRVAVLRNPGDPSEAALLRTIHAAARQIGVESFSVDARTLEEIERAFAAMKRERADDLVIAADAVFSMQRQQIAELAIKYRLPSITQSVIYAKAGGLMSYGQDLAEDYRRAAVYVDKILKGAKPGELPIEQPTRFRLVINAKTARALGLPIPQSLLVRADEVIE